jgi:hypothetical protein
MADSPSAKITCERERADQDAALIRHIAVINGLLVDAGPPDVGDRLGGRHRRAQIDIFGRHDTAGGILRIFEDLVDHAALLRSSLIEDPLHNGGGHLLHKGDGVVV